MWSKPFQYFPNIFEGLDMKEYLFLHRISECLIFIPGQNKNKCHNLDIFCEMELLFSTEALCKRQFNAEMDVNKLKASEQISHSIWDFH